MSSDVDVSIVVVCDDRIERTRACCDALRESADPAISTELVFVCGSSDDETAAFLRSIQSAEVRVVVDCNQGASVSRGRYVLFLNNDTEAHAGWLSPLVSTLERDDSVGVVGSKLLCPDGSVQHAGIVLKERNPGEVLIFRNLYSGGRADAPSVNRAREFLAVAAVGALFRRSVFESLGGFDSEFPASLGEIDLCLRVREAGFKVLYQPASVLTCRRAVAAPELADRQRLHAKWEGKLAPDEAEKLREDGRLELAQLAITLCAVRRAVSRCHEIPGLFPEGSARIEAVRRRRRQAFWQARLPWNLARREAEEALLHQYRALQAAASLLEKRETMR